MSEKRFTIEPTMVRECIVDNSNGEQLDTFDYTERLCEVLNELNDENEQLRQILKDIVVATDETYAKNMSMFKVTVILDFEKYNELRSCLK